MSGDFDENFYREVILDHYKHPRNYGTIDEPHAHAEGQNPLCGDEVAIDLKFDGDDKITDVKFSGRGCAISQAATSMLTEHLKGKTVAQAAALDKQTLLDDVGIPLTPIRLKCALLGLGVLKVALHRGKGTPLPDDWQGLDIA
jgi:nitrogen fixation protein NifU and related proteins